VAAEEEGRAVTVAVAAVAATAVVVVGGEVEETGWRGARKW
jgi:hypothetical protein